jgi:two-component sensor histidine kinase
MPLGIILNELVTNALKYAFPTPGKPGIIRVELSRTEGDVRLLVADNGVGVLPETQSTGSMGLDLVRTLTRQLGGSFELESRAGCVAQVVFQLE